MEKNLDYYRKNAEADYMTTPISVLCYISELEKAKKELSESLQAYVDLHADVERMLDGEPLEVYNKAKETLKKFEL